MVIITTSIIGSYQIVRGFSLIFGHWPSNVDLAIKIRNGESVFNDDGDAFIIYLFIMAIIAFYGYRTQRDKEQLKMDNEAL